MTEKSGKCFRINPAHRRKARQLALQALYQWHLAGGVVHDIERQFFKQNDMSKVDSAYFHDLLFGIMENFERLEESYQAILDRTLSDLDPVERSILKIGAFELQNCLDVPYRVVINEAIELAKGYGATDSYRYINGILDKLALKLRFHEIKQK